MSPVVRADVAVVGAGPAGMAAALAAADLGAQVVLVDAAPAVGGQIYRQPATARAAGRPGVGPKLPARLRRAGTHPRVLHLGGRTVWHAVAGAETALWLTGGEQVRVRAVVIATGATEIALPFPGWELPGVTTAGAAQALLKGQGVAVGRRVLVAGSGPLLLPAAAGLAQAGVEVLAVLEANPVTPATAARAAALVPYTGKLREAAGYAKVLARHRVPVLPGHVVTACQGDDQVTGATVSRVDRDWRPVPGTERQVRVDAVHASFGFSPALELPRQLGCADLPRPGRPTAAVWCDADQATSVPGVFAAGETTGVAGADVAELEGYVAGAAAARYLGKSGPEMFGIKNRERPESDERALERVRAALARARRFARRLDEVYPWRAGWLEWPGPETAVCRCEEVPFGAIGAAVADGARDVRAVKGVTRCGMGYCQGRVCGPAVQQAVAVATGRGLSAVGDLGSRPLLTPVPLATIAAAAPERGLGRLASDVPIVTPVPG
jgi:thioredoxin reductase